MLMLAAGCAGSRADFRVQQTEVTVADAMHMMRDAKHNPLPAISHKDYAKRRADAIVSFVDAAKASGADWRSLKRALESVTPLKPRTQIIPIRAVEAPFSGRKAWVIVQNWNAAGRELDHAKVWAIGVKDQSLLYAASQL